MINQGQTQNIYNTQQCNHRKNKEIVSDKHIHKFNIALVSDCFFPGKGGVETHIKTIGEELVAMGHKVIVITHRYGKYKGRVNIGNLVVYYLDIPIICNNMTFPTIFANYILFKEIFTRHNIDIVHGHQSLSNLCMESIYHASNMNIRTVMTDHSIFEVAKLERILVNNISKFICKNIDWAICVSNISKENTHLRTGIPLDRISIIPNGIVPDRFYPLQKTVGDKIRVLFISRLTFRKGIDLLIEALPLICKDKQFEVFIVGDGPKKSELIQTIDENDLHRQVRILGEVNYEEVPDILRSGDIFLNTSLTESFCMGVLEAASCGLLVVSTNVGGIHEVLQEDCILYSEPNPEDISVQIHNAARIVRDGRNNQSRIYETIIKKYDWSKIAKDTEAIYRKIPRKRIDFEKAILQYQGISNFISGIGTFIEYLQVKLFKMINVGKKAH